MGPAKVVLEQFQFLGSGRREDEGAASAPSSSVPSTPKPPAENLDEDVPF